MISCSDIHEFIPFGREHLKNHPGEIGLNKKPVYHSSQSELLNQLGTVSLNSNKDHWEIRKRPDGLTEEELYVSGSTVIWSQGLLGQEGSQKVIKSMNCESPVIQAVFSTFYTYPNEPVLIGENITDKPTGEAIPCICVLEKDCISVFLEKGELYSIALPFQVSKIWPSKYGIFLEKSIQPVLYGTSICKDKEALPILYSILHPLDEINPVIFKGNQGPDTLNYLSDCCCQVLYVNISPSLLVLYNSKTNLITVWRVRRAKQEENVMVLHNSMIASKETPFASSSALPSALHSLSLSQLVSPINQSHLISYTPPASWTSMAMMSQLNQQTPKMSNAPQNLLNSFRQIRSPFPYHYLRLGMSSSPCVSPGARSLRARNPSLSCDESGIIAEPLIPDVCLDLLLSEEVSGKPSRVFLMEDFVGQKYICFLLSHNNCLKCTKYEEMNDLYSLVFGTGARIQAKDALPLPGLKMIMVVDTMSSVLLYSGLTQVCRVNLSGLPNSTSMFKEISVLNSSNYFNSPANIRRSSLITSSRPSSAMDARFELILSPVPNERSDMDDSYIEDPVLPLLSSVVALHDCTDVRITVEHISGMLYRILVPEIWSSFVVERAFCAVKYVLPKDATLQLFVKWYSTRNAPGGGDLSPEGEWKLFSTTLMAVIGYDTDKLLRCSVEVTNSSSPLTASKKFKAYESGSDNDWEYLLSSFYHQSTGNSLSELLGLGKIGLVQADLKHAQGMLNTSASLFNYAASVLYALHLLYEDFKLNTVHWDFCLYLVPVLAQLAADLRLEKYLNHYWRDFPNLITLWGPPTQLCVQDVSKINFPVFFNKSPPSIFDHLISLINFTPLDSFPYIPDACNLTRNIVLLFSIAASNSSLNDISLDMFIKKVSLSGKKTYLCSIFKDSDISLLQFASSVHEKIVLLTDLFNLTSSDIQLLAPGISFLLMNAQHICRPNPPQNWHSSAYKLIQRLDLVLQKEQASKSDCNIEKAFKIKARVRDDKTFELPTSVVWGKKAKDDDDGMSTLDWEMLNLRWNKDQRVNEVRKMLDSSYPVIINIQQRPDVCDHDFLEEQERYLYALCVRTMALPVGRGMFTLYTHSPIVTDPLSIPHLNLTGKALSKGTTIDLSNNEVPTNMTLWPAFHNGVASGLKIASNCGDIDSTWIVYNKAKESAEFSNEHAGFLMALGLNGHIRNLEAVNMHDYISKGYEMTCVGLLLGVAVAKRGTMDSLATKLLSVHLECLLPPTSTELDVPHTVQVASILGIGLLYQGTAHRHMAEVLLHEIGRPPGPEMENSCDRESYSLAAGLGLGLVMFGQGAKAGNYIDLSVAGELLHFMEGGQKKPLSGIMREKYKSPSYQIKEGDRVNIDVTSPGAIYALGMIYFNTGKREVADWMVAPDTPYLLDQVRPDFLLLRTVAHGLIMWSFIIPSSKWVEGHVPGTVLMHVHRGGNQSTPGIDYESMHQAYYNILAGACFVLGLKFAGSANREAYRILWKYTRLFISYTKRSVAELAGKSVIETCLNVILLSLSIVMAGTGDLEVLRIIRLLRSRVGPANASIGYGSHLATHMALGFLFLGSGRFSLGTSDAAIMALLVSCFPKFPTHSNDNRYHLQALRHLYVLACEPRLLVPVDVNSGQLQQAKIFIEFLDTEAYKNISYADLSPFMLPELDKLSSVTLEGNPSDRYWPVKFSRSDDTWSVLESLLYEGGTISVKLKEGRYAYGEAPSSFHNKMAYFVSEDKAVRWTVKNSVMKEMFGSSIDLINAVLGSQNENGCLETDITENQEMIQALSTIVYECISIGKPEVINCWLAMYQCFPSVNLLSNRASFLIWQVKLLKSLATFLHSLSLQEQNRELRDDRLNRPLISAEQSLSFIKRVQKLSDEWKKDVCEELIQYLKGNFNQKFSSKCAFTLLLNDLPSPDVMKNIRGKYAKQDPGPKNKSQLKLK